jgi:hypothetical protein
MRFRFLDFGPTVRKKLGKFACLHAVYAGEDISQIFNRVNVVAFARCDEREMGCCGYAADIRANKKAIFAHQNKRLNSPFAGVVVYIKIRVIEKSGKCKPVIESIVNSPHQRICWAKG